MLARRTGWRNMYRWARASRWINAPWSATQGLVWEYDSKYATPDSSIRGKVQTKGSFSRAETPYYWDGDIIKTVPANTPRFEQLPGVRKALLLEPGATNRCIQSRNIGGWSASGSPTEAQDQVGIDGVVNTAWTIGDDDAAAQEQEYLTVTVANDSNVHCFSMFFKKDSTISRFPAIRLRLQGGTAVNYAIHLNTTTGAVVVETGSNTPTGYGADDYGSWWRLWVSGANNTTGNTTAVLGFWPAIGTTIGTPANAAQGSCIVDAAQFEFVARVPSSFVLTAGSTQARTTEASGLTWTLPAGIFTGTKVFTTVALVTLGGAKADFTVNHNILAVSAAANSLIYVDSSGRFAITDGTKTITKDPTIVRGTKYKVAVKADSTPQMNVGAVIASSAWTSAAWGTADTYDGDMAVGASLLLGQTLGLPMWVEKAWIFDRVLNDSEIAMLR